MLGWLQKLIAPPEAKGKSDRLGDRGENAAALHLRRQKNWTLITRNFRCDLGEVDIIARDGKTLVFVEVKCRESDEPTPEEQVNPSKQQQIVRVAKYYMTRYGYPPPPVRFDVIAVVWPNGRDPEIRHTEGAFGE